FVRHHGFERRTRELELKIDRPSMALVDDRAFTVRPDEVASHFVDGFLCGGQANAAKFLAGELLQALERKREMGAAPAADDGVDFVDDQRPHCTEHLAASL